MEVNKSIDLGIIPQSKDRTPRQEMPALPLEKRTLGFDEIELGLTETAAKQEANRCLNCGIFIAATCDRCDGKFLCIKYCPEQVLDFLAPEKLRALR